MTLFFALLAIVFASAALMAIFQWGAQNHETQQLRRLRDRVEHVVIDHDLAERTLTRNSIATILKELDQCLKP